MRIEQQGHEACFFGKLEVGQCFMDTNENNEDVYLKIVDGSSLFQSMPTAVNLSNNTLYYVMSDQSVIPITAEVQIKSRLKGVAINNEDYFG